MKRFDTENVTFFLWKLIFQPGWMPGSRFIYWRVTPESLDIFGCLWIWKKNMINQPRLLNGKGTRIWINWTVSMAGGYAIYINTYEWAVVKTHCLSARISTRYCMQYVYIGHIENDADTVANVHNSYIPSYSTKRIPKEKDMNSNTRKPSL